jgi:hypothetical protein
MRRRVLPSSAAIASGPHDRFASGYDGPLAEFIAEKRRIKLHFPGADVLHCTRPTQSGCTRDAERRREADGQCAPFLTQALAPNSRAASSLAQRIPSSVR